MAITVAAVTPTPTNRTSAATTFSLTDVGTTFAKHDMIVVCIAADNAGSGGNTLNVSSVTDSKGNTYSERTDTVYDPGAASAGVENAIYTATIDTALVATDDLTITFGATTAAVAVTIWKITNDGTVRPVYLTTGTASGSATGSPTVTSSSIASGNIIIGHLAAETNASVTADADTSNGSWSSINQATGNTGTAATSVRSASQAKLTTGAGTQTFNPTLTSADTKISWISIGSETIPVGPVIVTGNEAFVFGSYPGSEMSSQKLALPSGLQDGDMVVLWPTQFNEHAGDDPGNVAIHEGTSGSNANAPSGTNITSQFTGTADDMNTSSVYRSWGQMFWGIAGDGTGGTFNKAVTHWDVKWSPSPNPGTYPNGLPDTVCNLMALVVRASDGGTLGVDVMSLDARSESTPGAAFTAEQVTTTEANTLVLTAMHVAKQELDGGTTLTGYTLWPNWLTLMDGYQYDMVWYKNQATPGVTGTPTISLDDGSHPFVSYIRSTIAIYEATDDGEEHDTVGSGSLTLAASGVAVKDGATVGTSSLVISASGTVVKHVARTGSTTFALSASGADVKHGVATAATALSFSATGAAANKDVSTVGATSLALTATGIAATFENKSTTGATSLTLSGSAAVQRHSATAGATSVALAANGGAIGHRATVGSGALSLSGVGSTANKDVSTVGATSIALAASGSSGATADGDTVGSTSISLSASGSVVKHVAVTAATSFALAAAATDIKHATPTGTSSLVIGASGVAAKKGSTTAATGLTLTANGYAGAVIVRSTVGSTSLAFGQSASVTKHASPYGTAAIAFSSLGAVIKRGHATATAPITLTTVGTPFKATGVIGDTTLTVTADALAIKRGATIAPTALALAGAGSVAVGDGSYRPSSRRTLTVAEEHRVLRVQRNDRTLHVPADRRYEWP